MVAAPQNIDDYYSNKSSDASSGTSSEASSSGVLLKKKIKIKAKVTEDSPVDSHPELPAQETVSIVKEEPQTPIHTSPESLNEALEKNTRSKVTVVSRAQTPQKIQDTPRYTAPVKQEKHIPSTGDKPLLISEDAAPEEIIVLAEKSAPKFKPGFSKVASKPVHHA